jgi:hypothetical protein
VAQARPPAIHSPDVNSDLTVMIRLVAPKATEVRLTGNPLKELRAMEKDRAVVWSTGCKGMLGTKIARATPVGARANMDLKSGGSGACNSLK